MIGKKVHGHGIEADTATRGLERDIQQPSPREIVKLFGNIDFDPSYDHKEHRGRKINDDLEV